MLYIYNSFSPQKFVKVAMIHVSKINIKYANTIYAFALCVVKRLMRYDWFAIYHISLIKYRY